MHAPVSTGFTITPMAVADAAEWSEYVLLPEVTRLTSAVAQSVADLVPMIERTVSSDPGAPVLFAVRDADSGRFVASIGFHTVSAVNRSAEITYTVRPELWGRGIATALCGAAVRWAFEQRQWLRVQATTLVEHVASQRVLSKSGFEFEGRVRNFRVVRGEPRDYLLYARIPTAEGQAAERSGRGG